MCATHDPVVIEHADEELVLTAPVAPSSDAEAVGEAEVMTG